MTIDDACRFFKELLLRHKVPAELHCGPSGVVRIIVPRNGVPEDSVCEIAKEARRCGFIAHKNERWLTFDG